MTPLNRMDPPGWLSCQFRTSYLGVSRHGRGPGCRVGGTVAHVLKLGRGEFADTDLLVMAIVNRTRDSFYDQGATCDEAAPSTGSARWSPRVPTWSTSAA